MTRGRSEAFTLIELLVVAGLIALLVGLIAGVLRPGEGRGFALRTAQAELASAVALAREQAATRQVRTRVAIDASAEAVDGNPGRFLRRVQVVCETEFGNDLWISLDRPVLFPAGIYLVPPPGSAGVASEEGIVSSSSRTRRAMLSLRGANGIETVDAFYLEFGPEGRADNSEARFVVSTARRVADGTLRFSSADALRVVRVRPHGTVSLDEPEEAGP